MDKQSIYLSNLSLHLFICKTVAFIQSYHKEMVHQYQFAHVDKLQYIYYTIITSILSCAFFLTLRYFALDYVHVQLQCPFRYNIFYQIRYTAWIQIWTLTNLKFCKGRYYGQHQTTETVCYLFDGMDGLLNDWMSTFWTSLL